MLNWFGRSSVRDCSGYSRRDFLRIGGLGVAGLTLADLLAVRASAASGTGNLTGKSVVFLFLNGGPAQIETFDPKMSAPAEIRSITGEAASSLPGVSFGGTFPLLAARAHRMAVVRSYQPRNGNHDGGVKVLSGENELGASAGAIYARVAGVGSPRTGMPSNVFVSPQSVGKPAQNTPFNYGGPMNTGSLPSMYAPFHPTAEEGGGNRLGRGGPKEGLLADMELRLPLERMQDRRQLLASLDVLKRRVEGSAGVANADRFQQQAYEAILGGVSQAFDLANENPAVLARYETADMPTPASLARQLPQTAAHSPIMLGRQLLLARRLCEAGCGFITIGVSGWDMHGNNGFGIEDGMKILGPAVDHAVAAFLDDLEERGLSDQILLVIAGELGRTPKIVTRTAAESKNITRAGRDHWANLGALALAGGGWRMGQVIGESDNQAGSPKTYPITSADLLATILHTVFDAGQLRLDGGVPGEIRRIVAAREPIRELV